MKGTRKRPVPRRPQMRRMPRRDKPSLTEPQKKRLSTSRSKVNPISKRELELHTLQTGRIYNQKREPLEKNLTKKWDQGTYDYDKSVLGYLNVVDFAVKDYEKEYGSKGDKIFSKADRVAVAVSLARRFRSELRITNPRIKTEFPATQYPIKVGGKK